MVKETLITLFRIYFRAAVAAGLATFILGSSARAETAGAPSALTVPAESAKKRGIATCLPAVNALSGSLIGASPYSATTSLATRGANQRMFNTALAIDGPSRLAFLTVTPGKDGTCDSAAQQILVSAESCDKVREAQLKARKQNTQIKNALAYVGADGNLLYLMPAGGNCVIVRQTLRFTDATPAKKK